MTRTEMPKEMTLSFKKQLLFFVIVSVSLLSLAEAGIRTWAYFFRTSYERYDSTTNRLELVPDLRFRVGEDEFMINSKGFVGPEFDQDKSKGTFRVISIGDSCTFTNGIWARAYPALLERLLNKDQSGKRFEVINAGIEGYDSTLARSRLTDDILKYDPDMVTIYIGWNDLMKTSPQNISSSGEVGLLSRIKEGSYLFKAYRKLIFVYLRPLFSKPKVGVHEGQVHPFEDFVPTRYRGNVEAMIKTLKDKGVRVMVFTLSTVVTPGMSLQELQTQNVMFPYYVGAYDVSRLLALVRAYNKVILELADAYAVPVVDLNATFNGHDRRKLFWDTMHPNYPGNEMIARAIFDRIRDIQRDAQQCRLYGWDDLCSPDASSKR
jgi:lysophospholipase L1-like esterase